MPKRKSDGAITDVTILKKKKKEEDAEDVAADAENAEVVEKPKKKKAEDVNGNGETSEEPVKKKKKKKAKVTDMDVDGAAAEAEADPAEADQEGKKKKKKKKVKGTDGDASKLMAFMDEAVEKVTPKSAGQLWSYKVDPELAAMPQSKIDEFLAANNITFVNSKSQRPVMQFKYAAFPAELAKALSEFDRPTPIQAVSWAPIFGGSDLIGIAATGSGKTLAFGIPAIIYICNMLAKVKVSGGGKRRIRALVMSPTRELAMQIQDHLAKFGKSVGVTSVVIYGGAPKGEQRQLLNDGPDIVVATPGRLLDFVNDKVCDLSDVGFFVLDEADRMLDMGFEPDIKRIVAEIKRSDRQTVMFSATWPQAVRKLSEQYLKDPAHITVGSTDLSANANIKQIVEVIDPKAKDSRLMSLLKECHKSRKNRVMIFALYKKEAARLEQLVQRNGYNVGCIQGDLSQEKRTEAIRAFKDGTCPLLIATDVAARGIDVPDVEYVINYTYPLTTEDYCHRIGRTGRAGKKGTAYTFFTLHDKAHSGSLINVLKQASQNVPDDLMKFGTTVKKKLDPTYGAFTRDIDPNAKATKIKFDSDGEE